MDKDKLEPPFPEVNHDRAINRQSCSILQALVRLRTLTEQTDTMRRGSITCRINFKRCLSASKNMVDRPGQPPALSRL
ncbi:MAG: hypothetical protein U0670_17660 [Anaerolineae bacterium]